VIGPPGSKIGPSVGRRRAELLDLCGEVVNALDLQLAEEGVLVGEMPGQGFFQHADLGVLIRGPSAQGRGGCAGRRSVR
jgi:hypothetical protein